VLFSLPTSSAPSSTPSSGATVSSQASSHLAIPAVRASEPRSDSWLVVPVPADRAAGAGALLWMAAAAILALRLIGGWWTAGWIRRRAFAVTDDAALEVAERLRHDLRLSSPVTLLQSPDVEAPVVIGWRTPVLILPTDVGARLSPDMVSALLAHELAHIKRRDYLANVLQSIVELLLCFSPAVSWMSRCIREAREYCCDDVAVEKCGGATHYVHALTTLASLGTVNTARPVMGAAGPRLVSRVRRLLQGEAPPRFSAVRLAVFATVLVTLAVSGVRVTTASASRAARLAGAGESTSPSAQGQDFIPYGFATEQDGSGVDFHVLTSTREAPLERASIRNLTDQPVAGVQFVAAVERWHRGIPRRLPVRLFVSDVVPVSVGAGQTVEVSPKVITEAQIQQIAADNPGARLQLFFGLSAVRYANGAEWSITPNPAALTGSDVFDSSRPQIPRSLITRDAARSEVPFGPCRGTRDRLSSHGARMPIRDEPGRLGRCENGRWVEER
jgi:beta-lactamase regulating signal transducer with metallopeptidase domain